jgi:hypothetical protein
VTDPSGLGSRLDGSGWNTALARRGLILSEVVFPRHIRARLAEGGLDQEVIVKITQDSLVAEYAQSHISPVLTPKPQEASIKVAGVFRGLGIVTHIANFSRSTEKTKKHDTKSPVLQS